MAIAVGSRRRPERFGTVYAGTEPSAVFRSDDGGDTWTDLAGRRALPSAGTWSFPPRPETHHVRWIEADAIVADRVFVAIDAGALVRTLDGGRTWKDRVDDGPYDTHTAATHRLATGRIYSAAGDGYFESADAADSWRSPEEGVSDHFVQPTIEAILAAAQSGQVGDGKIFVLPVEKVYRIRTGEEDQAAVTPVAEAPAGIA